MNLVSIIIPTYNSEKFLNRTILSVLNQIYKNWELIIVDDFSQDKTRNIIKKWEAKDKRISSIFLDKNSGGPATPKNVGISNSKGEYIAFLDHDDEWLPEKLEKQVNFLEDKNNKNYGFVTCDSIINISEKEYDYITPIYRLKNQLINLLKANFIHSCSSVIIRKSVFDDIGNFDTRLKVIDDWDLYIRILQNYYIGVISEKLFVYYSQKTGAGKTLKFSNWSRETEYILNKHKYLFLTNSNIYSKNLRTIGVYYCLSKNFKVGRSYILKSFNLNYQPVLTIILILFSFLNTKLIFTVLLHIRRKISNIPLDKT